MKYLVTDDQPAFAMLITKLLKELRGSPEDEVIAAHSASELLEILQRSSSDELIVILDLLMPGLSRLDLVRAVRALAPSARIIAYSGSESVFLAKDVIKAGVHGYVSKQSSPDHLAEAVRSVADGGTYFDPWIDLSRAESEPWSSLTPKQREVCVLIMRHGNATQAAKADRRAYDTIWNHWSDARAKLGITYETELAAYFYSKGLDYLLDE